MGAVSWFLMIAVGLALMWAQTRTRYDVVDQILVRMAGGAFMGAGTVGFDGWIGNMISTVLGWITSLADSLGAPWLGNTVVWIGVLGVALLWVAAMLPDNIFEKDAPDWLLYSGVILPSMMGSVPGPLGNGLTQVFQWAGDVMVSFVAGLI